MTIRQLHVSLTEQSGDSKFQERSQLFACQTNRRTALLLHPRRKHLIFLVNFLVWSCFRSLFVITYNRGVPRRRISAQIESQMNLLPLSYFSAACRGNSVSTLVVQQEVALF